MSRKLTVEIVGDASSLDRAFKKSSASAKQFGATMDTTSRRTARSFSRLKTGLGVGAGFGATAAIRESISAASDLEEQVGKVDIVFGKNAETVKDWSTTLVRSAGLSQRAALTSASSIAALVKPIGITGDQAVRLAETLTQRGADLAAFYNTDVQSALDAITSGVVGEAEPLRKYGVQLSENRVQAEALAETGKKNIRNLTLQEKTQARVNIILKDSSVAQGNFAKTSGDAAQQTKIFEANLANLEATLGKRIVPKLAGATSALNDFFDAASGANAKKTGGQKPWVFRQRGLLDILHLRGQAGDVFGPIGRLFTGDALPPGFGQPPAGALGPAGLGKAAEQTKRQAQAQAAAGKALRGAQAAAREAFRQQVQDQAAFAVDKTQLTKGISDDLAANQKLNALLLRRIAGGHDTIEIQREQLQVQLTINGLLAQQAESRKAAAAAAKQAALDARSARQFRELGFGPHGEERIPGAKALARQLQSVSSEPLSKASRSAVDRIRRTMRDNFGKLRPEVRARIKEMIDDIDRQFRQRRGVDVTRFSKAASGQFVLAGAHPQGSGTIHVQNMTITGVHNIKELENELMKRKKQRAGQRRSTR